MGWFSRKITVVTHNGNFHADEVFACAAFRLWATNKDLKVKIIRSREKLVIE
jgi:uncharacterized UPF0160 family protein